MASPERGASDEERLAQVRALTETTPVSKSAVLAALTANGTEPAHKPALRWLVRHGWLARWWKQFSSKSSDDDVALLLNLVVYGLGYNRNITHTPQFELLATRLKHMDGLPLLFRFLAMFHSWMCVFDSMETYIAPIDGASLEYVELLLLLLRMCNSSRHVISMLKKHQVVARCRTYHRLYPVDVLSSYILYYMHYGSRDNKHQRLERVQQAVYARWPASLFVVEASPDPQRVRAFFESLAVPDQHLLCHDLGEHVTDEAILVEVLMAYVFVPTPDSTVVQLSGHSEFEMYDRFASHGLSYVAVFDTTPQDETDYLMRVRTSLWMQGLLRIARHLDAVMERVRPADGSDGASKYWHPVSGLRALTATTFELKLPRDVGLFFLLVEMVPRNKYSEVARVKNWGLSMVRLCQRLTLDSPDVVFACANAPEVADFVGRMQHVVTLPESVVELARLECLEHKQFVMPSVDEADDVVMTPLYHLEGRKRARVERPRLGLHLELEQVFQSIVHNKFTLVHELLRFNTLDAIVERVLEEDLTHRTLVVTLSQLHVNLFHANDRWVRYGYPQEIACRMGQLHAARQLLEAAGLAKTPVAVTKLRWRRFLALFEQHQQVGEFPFGTASTIKQATLKYLEIVRWYDTVAANEFLEHDPEPWRGLYNTHNVIISLDEYVALKNATRAHCFTDNQVLNPFDHVIFINGPHEATPLVCGTDDIQVTVIGGPQSDIIPINDINLDDTFVRPEFVDDDDNFDINLNPTYTGREFNPGFAATSAFVRVAGAVNHAEYVVLLFQYMRLLGYPANRVTMFVPGLRQQALVREVLERKCGDPVARDGEHDFQYGWPAGVEVGGDDRVRANDYALVMCAGTDVDEERYQFMGRLGNYAVGDFADHLEICAGENYATKTRDELMAHHTIEGKGHLQLYIDQMEKQRFNRNA